MIKSINTLTIREWILHERTTKQKYLFTVRIELLKYLLKKKVVKLYGQVYELFNSNDLELKLSSNNYKLYLVNVIILLRQLETRIHIELHYQKADDDEIGKRAKKISRLTKEWKEVYRGYVKGSYKPNFECAEKTRKKIKFYETKLKEKAEEKQTESGKTISETVAQLDSVDLEAPLFMLKDYISKHINKNG